MKLREIIKTIRKNSQDLDEPLIMDELMSGIANAFELRNRLGKVYDWTSTRTSNALSNNWLPPELIKSYGLIGFHTALEKDVDAFFANYGKNILSNDLCMDLTSLYRKESAEMNSYTASSANKALIDCLDLAFRQLYEAQKSSSKKKPFKIN